MKIRKKLKPRTIYSGPNGEIKLTNQQYAAAILAAFNTRTGYPGYLTCESMNEHVKHEVRPFDTAPPLVDMVISDFNPADFTVELSIADDRVRSLEAMHVKDIDEIELLTAWLVATLSNSIEFKVTAFYFQSPNDQATESSDEIKNKSTP